FERSRLHDRAISVAAACGSAKLYSSFVGLFGAGEHTGELGGFTQKQDEHPSGHGIERSGMTHSSCSERSPHATHHVMTCHAFGLVDHKYTVRRPAGADLIPGLRAHVRLGARFDSEPNTLTAAQGGVEQVLDGSSY